jgi:hypothetical protein
MDMVLRRLARDAIANGSVPAAKLFLDQVSPPPPPPPPKPPDSIAAEIDEWWEAHRRRHLHDAEANYQAQLDEQDPDELDDEEIDLDH